MFIFRRLIFRVQSLLRRKRVEDEFRSEIDAHISLLTEENIDLGMSIDEAHRVALLRFGSVVEVEEDHRTRRGLAVIEGARQDFRYAIGQMRRNPGFYAIAILTLGLGIGACTSIFSVVNSVLLRPLPYRNSDRLVWIWSSNPLLNELKNPASGADFLDWNARSQSLEQLSAIHRWGVTLTGLGDPEIIIGNRVSANYFRTLGVAPTLGRDFVADDETPTKNHIVILSNELWHARFAGDAKVLGRQIKLDSNDYTIVGVLPADFRSIDDAKIWSPYSFGPDELSRGNQVINVIARLKAGVTVNKAQQELDLITDALAHQYPATNTNRKALIVLLQQHLVGNSKTTLLVLMSAVSLVLLIACANIANLFLARAIGRKREIAIRRALGASRGRLFRQLLTESLTVSMFGGILGVAAAFFSIPVLIALSPTAVSRQFQIGIDIRVLAFTLIVCFLSGVSSGLVPALKCSGSNLDESLSDGGRNATTGAANHKINNTVIIFEIALALVLLIGAGLLIRTFYHLRHTNAGFDSTNMLTTEIVLPERRYSDKQRQVAFCRDLLNGVQALPGVKSAGVINDLPLSGSSTTGNFDMEGRPDWTPGQEPSVEKYAVSTNYFRAMGIPLLRGREFSDDDTSGKPGVVLISESMARRFWPDENPIGKRLNTGWYNNQWQEIVGIVGDVKQTRLDADAPNAVYTPYLQSPRLGMRLVIRMDNKSIVDLGALRAVVKKIDADLPLFNVTEMINVVSKTIEEQRFDMLVLGLFAATALLLAAIGTYGVISYSVIQRTREIGIRMALGGRPQQIVSMVISRGLTLGATGIALGLLLAFILTRSINCLLFQVRATDPMTFFACSLALLFAAMLASYLPAKKASRVDPMISIRNE